MLPNFKNSPSDLASPARVAKSPPPSLGARLSSAVGDQPSFTPSVLGPDLTISGNINSKGEVRIDGEILGDVQGIYVIIGEKGRITGGLIAEEIVVFGHVMGSIRGTRVMLRSSSHVEADVFHESLVIEQGASFEGRSRCSHNPTTEPNEPVSATEAFSSAP